MASSVGHTPGALMVKMFSRTTTVPQFSYVKSSSENQTQEFSSLVENNMEIQT